MLEPYNNKKLFELNSIKDKIFNDFVNGKLHHSLIFVGNKGIGKATLCYHIANKILDYETNLKDVQERAKLSTIAATTFYGTQKDRDVSFIMRKPYVKPQKPPKKEKVKKEKKRKNKDAQDEINQESENLDMQESSNVINQPIPDELPSNDAAQDLLEDMMQNEQQI